MSDSQLLRRFAAGRSEAAFGELVARHVSLVYSAALRQTNGDAHLAQDVAQVVFADFARKAPALSENVVLAGWLHRATIFAARQILRTERRRKLREQQAVTMNAIQSENENDDWQQIRPLLDEALERLNKTDRDALLLRFFENQSLARVGASLGGSEDAARKRVNRALEKLREILSRRGVTTTTATLSTVISANAIQTAPAGLATTLASASIATAGTGTFTFLKIMTATKIKLASSAIVVACAATAFVHQQQTQNKLRAENESLQQQIGQLQMDNENFSNQLSNVGDSKNLSDEQFMELLKLRGEVGVLRRRASDAREQVITANQKTQVAEEKLATKLSAQAKFKTQEIETVNDMKMLGLAERVYAGDNNNVYATDFEQITNELGSKLYETLRTGDVELVNAGITNIMQYPRMIISREIMSHQAPDGMWHRIYGLVDGSVHVATSYDGNFDAWEKANTTTPPNQ